MRFLGIINYDRVFIGKLADKLDMFYKMVNSKARALEWTAEAVERFEEIKSLWSQRLELNMPDMAGSFEIECDASDKGIGAVLRQDKKPIFYISRILKPAEKNYTITEKEVLAIVWALDKAQYYLRGKKFRIYTDHKPIEEIKTKPEFGTPRISRWLEKLSQYDFEICYTKGKDIIQADILSREIVTTDKDKIVQESEKLSEKILKIHNANNHRRTISDLLKKEGINIEKKAIRQILNNCTTCIKKDKNFMKSGGYVETRKPGEIVAIDLMSIDKKNKVIMLIDYFSRFLYGKIIQKKTQEVSIKFIKEVFEDLKFTRLVADNGKEFGNEKLKTWCKENNVALDYAIPYFHQSNGRIERANRTIRAALKKTEGELSQRLKAVLDNYNSLTHRGIGMSPREARKAENYDLVLQQAAKYKKEFKKREIQTFDIGNRVILRKEIKESKMDNEYEEKGKIANIIRENVYRIHMDDGRTIIRHGLQLKIWPGNVVATKVESLTKSKPAVASENVDAKQEADDSSRV